MVGRKGEVQAEMRSRAFHAALILAAVLLAAMPVAAFAQELSVSTDKQVYSPGETVVVKGTAPANNYVSITIKDPNGNEVDFKVVKAGEDGTYTVEFKIPAKIPYGTWKTYGLYTVVAQLGPKTATAQFQLQPIGYIVGVVVDENGNPIAGATVCVKETGYKTTTDENGQFMLSLDVGTYTIVASKPNYRSGSTTITVTEAGVTEEVKITLYSYDYLLSRLEEQITALSEEIAGLADKAYVDKVVKEVADRVSSIEARLDEINAALAELQGLKTTVEDNKKMIEELSAALDEVKKSLDEMRAAVEARLASLEAGKADKSIVDELAGKIDELSKTVDGLQHRLSMVEATTQTISQLQSTQEDLKKTIEDLKKTIKTLEKLGEDVKSAASKAEEASQAAGSASGTAMVGLAVAIIGLIIAIVAIILVYRKMA